MRVFSVSVDPRARVTVPPCKPAPSTFRYLLSIEISVSIRFRELIVFVLCREVLDSVRAVVGFEVSSSSFAASAAASSSWCWVTDSRNWKRNKRINSYQLLHQYHKILHKANIL